MRLKPISFLSIYPDGLVKLEGHAFKVGERQLVVHKERPQLYEIGPHYRNYLVSSVLGFGIDISPTKDRREAVAFAYNEVPKISQDEWAERCKLAEQIRRNLQVVEG
jgi:hypothetical protein